MALAIEREQQAVLQALPLTLSNMPRSEVPLRSFDMVGLTALRALMGSQGDAPSLGAKATAMPDLPHLDRLVDALANGDRGLIMVMGKGGVGKTTVAAAIAVGLTKRAHSVHLTTTDPAAHVSLVVDGTMPGLTVDRIDPDVETLRYIDKIMSTKGRDLDDAGRDLLREDLASPCTEEVAVFHAFSRVVAETRSAFVVMDTAPTGHTLLLLDATGAYHREMTRQLGPEAHGKLTTPLMRLQDPDYTRVILVTLPETTPVSEAAALQADLQRAGIAPFAWVINKGMSGSQTQDPLLLGRIAAEAAQVKRVTGGLAQRVFILPYSADALVGIARLQALSRGTWSSTRATAGPLNASVSSCPNSA